MIPTEVKNDTGHTVVAKFDGQEIVFAPEATVDLARFFPVDQVFMVAQRFQMKYGLTLVKEKPVKKVILHEDRETGQISEVAPEKPKSKKR